MPSQTVQENERLFNELCARGSLRYAKLLIHSNEGSSEKALKEYVIHDKKLIPESETANVDWKRLVVRVDRALTQSDIVKLCQDHMIQTIDEEPWLNDPTIEGFIDEIAAQRRENDLYPIVTMEQLIHELSREISEHLSEIFVKRMDFSTSTLTKEVEYICDLMSLYQAAFLGGIHHVER